VGFDDELGEDRELVDDRGGVRHSSESDEMRTWQAGDVFFLEDTTFPGHGTTIFEDATMGVVWV